MVKLNTFSIAARCEHTGQFGVAVSTAIPGVGMLCPFGQAGVGAVATQSFVNPYLGFWALEYLAEGHTAAETVELLKTRDSGLSLRQFSVVDRHGGAAAYTGDACDTWRGQLTGPNYALAGNMLTGPETLQAMEAAFVQVGAVPFAQRLLDVLSAGQQAGGDKRGKVSAALKIYSTEAYPYLDLRVDEHPDPVTELYRIYRAAQDKLIPLIHMMPTRANPAGLYDLTAVRGSGILQDGPLKSP